MCDTLAVPAQKRPSAALALFAKNSDRERNEVAGAWSCIADAAADAGRAASGRTYIRHAGGRPRPTLACSADPTGCGARRWEPTSTASSLEMRRCMRERSGSASKPALTGMDLVRLGLERGSHRERRRCLGDHVAPGAVRPGRKLWASWPLLLSQRFCHRRSELRPTFLRPSIAGGRSRRSTQPRALSNALQHRNADRPTLSQALKAPAPCCVGGLERRRRPI